MRIFSSLTRKGLYLIFLFDEGRVNSYVGVEMVGKGIIITTLQLKLFIVVFKRLFDYDILYKNSSGIPLSVESEPVLVPVIPRVPSLLVPISNPNCVF